MLGLAENGDLWEDIVGTLRKSGHRLQLSWVSSHCKKETDINIDEEQWVYAGNAAADELASTGARQHQVGEWDAQRLKDKEAEHALVIHDGVRACNQGPKEDAELIVEGLDSDSDAPT